MDEPVGVRYHRLVDRDAGRAFRYYREEGGMDLAERFYKEFTRRIAEAAVHPKRFPPLDSGLRRANLRRFPYHFLYRMQPGTITVLVLRHDKSHPDRGLKRK
jgi:plasmid stabilization system protein ParE